MNDSRKPAQQDAPPARETTSADTEHMSRLLERLFMGGLQETVEWFHEQMPDYYFQVSSEDEQVRHLEIFHSMRRMQSARLAMVDDGEAGKVLFFGRPSPEALLNALNLLGDRRYHRVELHSTRDRSLCIFSFVYDEQPATEDFDFAGHRQRIIDATCRGTDCVAQHIIDRYLNAVGDDYLARSHPPRIARHVRAWIALQDPEGVHIEVDEYRDDGAKPVTRILIAGAMRRRFFSQQLARLLKRYDLLLERGYMDVVPSFAGEGNTLICTVYLTDQHGQPLGKALSSKVANAMQGIRRRFEGDLLKLYDSTEYEPRHFELLAAAIDFVAQILPAEHPFLEVREVGHDAMLLHADLCKRLADLVDHRFGPKPKSERWWHRQAKQLREEILSYEDTAVATVLEAMLDFVTALQLTNLYRPQRLGQIFQLDPSVLPTGQYKHRPYGVFFFHGRHGMGFHVRFRPSARGGLRLLMPRNNEQLGRYRDRLLREVYDLAWAQQLKNKDIPEGGSKCIALVRPGDDATDMVKQLADSLLDVLVPHELVPDVRGPHGEERGEELVFLGPDENMTPDRIVWVGERARLRGFEQYLTLMSSKPGAGINHKQYGVTSEGVYRWIHHVLPIIDIKRGKPWTMKMTGGPDGDVGGNLLKILHRDQRKRCRVVGIADGSGCAYDPDGLSWGELMRLVKHSLPIGQFDPSMLSGADAHVTVVGDRASEEMRNNFHNEIDADIFVPCGGRPHTINDRNWRQFCGHEGRPSARAMIEGANIFISEEARRELQRAGLIVIKDSSANKGGVVCSSYEILACLIMNEKEFSAIKVDYVKETIARIRTFVDDEAEALIEGWRRRRGGVLLSDLSEQMSAEVNRISGLLLPLIGDLLDDNRLKKIWRRELEEHCPPVLVERYRDRFHERLPLEHSKALLAKRYASRMVYREGLTWCRNYVLEDMAHDVLLAYLDAGEQVRRLTEAVKVSALGHDPSILSAISDGSRRELVRRRLGR